MADVRVFILDDRVEIVSPGPFPKGVTPKKPKHKPVNKILSDLMYDIGYIEKYGSGIYLENELCLENGNPKPVYEIDTIQTKVIFKSQVKDITVVELNENLLNELNERQKKALEYVITKKRITSREYRKINDVSKETAWKDINELLKKSLLVKKSSGAHTYYTLETER